ncbi:E3 ubiquitin-protein ligase TRIM39-like [Genypterus blacodes]|uniref:E3 ubiquitin-protein ligase TRIM39-like n=1 Tax=Genypterus blacodes TaxID=154954 RepID=UPI003F777D93
MALSGTMLSEKQFLCSICLQVFTDPVTIPCGHNFCHACIQGAWDSSDICHCPTCEKSFTSQPEISINTAFKELSDMFRKVRVGLSASPATAAEPGDVPCDVCAGTSAQLKALKSCLVCLTSYCEAHLEPHERVATLRIHKLIDPAPNLQDRMCKKHERLLEMFCRVEQECVCQFCTETEHKGHQTTTIEEECRERKVHMKKTKQTVEQMIEERMQKVEEIKESVKLSTMSSAREQQESDLLFTTVIGSVEARRAEVGVEIKEKQEAVEWRAEGLVYELQQEAAELQRRNTELEELQNTEDHFRVLQMLPALISPPPTREWSELGVHSEPCVGTVRRALSKLDNTLKTQLDRLKEEELKRMQKYAVDVVLDPHTAHPNIAVSAEGKEAGHGEQLQIVPDNPQRFDPVICVLGQKGFLSGRFYFQVAVGRKTYWDLGVVKESVNRKGRITSTPEHGFWSVRLRNGDEYRALDSPSIILQLKEKPQMVGVFVDYEEGAVSFFNVDARSHIYTFAGCVFTERLFPFFSPGVRDEGKNKMPLVITDVNHAT